MGASGLRQNHDARVGFGVGGDCVCPNCGERLAHQRGVPCNKVKCPGCGTMMARER